MYICSFQHFNLGQLNMCRHVRSTFLNFIHLTCETYIENHFIHTCFIHSNFRSLYVHLIYRVHVFYMYQVIFLPLVLKIFLMNL